MLRLRLSRGREEFGPFPPAFRHAFAALARSVYRVTLPELPLHLYPCGLTRAAVPLNLSLRLPAAAEACRLFIEAAHGRMETLLTLLDGLPEPSSIPQQDYWNEDRDRLDAYLRSLALRPLAELRPREDPRVQVPDLLAGIA